MPESKVKIPIGQAIKEVAQIIAKKEASDAKAETEDKISQTQAAFDGKIADTKKELSGLSEQVEKKQDTLVPGSNIKTVNNQSLIGAGNINIQGTDSDMFAMDDDAINSAIFRADQGSASDK